MWYHVFRWLGWKFILPLELVSLLSFMLELGWGKKERFSFLLVCQILCGPCGDPETLTSFSGKETSMLQMVDMVKFTSWK